MPDVREYLSGNAVTAYPFLEAVANPLPQDWLLDAVIVPVNSAVVGAKLTQLSVIGADLRLTVSLYNKAGTPLYTELLLVPAASLVDFRSNDAGLVTLTTVNATYKLVLGRAGVPFIGTTLTLSPPVPFAHTVVVPVPTRLTSLLVANYDDGVLQAYTNNDTIPLGAQGLGSNVALTGAGTISVGRGLGAGLFDPCQGLLPPVKSLNQAKPDNDGYFLLQTGPCYVKAAGVNEILFRNDCRAPCTEDIMNGTQRYINRVKSYGVRQLDPYDPMVDPPQYIYDVYRKARTTLIALRDKLNGPNVKRDVSAAIVGIQAQSKETPDPESANGFNITLSISVANSGCVSYAIQVTTPAGTIDDTVAPGSIYTTTYSQFTTEGLSAIHAQVLAFDPTLLPSPDWVPVPGGTY